MVIVAEGRLSTHCSPSHTRKAVTPHLRRSAQSKNYRLGLRTCIRFGFASKAWKIVCKTASIPDQSVLPTMANSFRHRARRSYKLS